MTSDFNRPRNAILARALVAIAGLAFGLAAGLDEDVARSIAPAPDAARLLAEEIAAAHYASTGTTTAVREESDVVAALASLQARRPDPSARPPLPPTIGRAPARPGQSPWGLLPPGPDDLVQFSFDPAEPDIEPLDRRALERAGSPVRVTVPADVGDPVAVFLYAPGQRLLGVVFYQMADRRIAPPPKDTRVLEPIGFRGVVRTFGRFAGDADAFPVHAFLLSTAGTGVEDLGRSPLDLARLRLLVPLLSRASAASAAGPVDIAAAETRLARAGRAPVVGVRALALTVALPASLCWLAMIGLALRRLRARYAAAYEALGATRDIEARPPPLSRFLVTDLDGAIERRERDATAAREALEASEREAAARRDLLENVASLRSRLALTDGERAEIDAALEQASDAELRAIAGALERRVSNEARERADLEQRDRHRDREIRRIVAEFDAVPAEERLGAARIAWVLYEDALAAEDPRRRLELLKTARKELPRHLRSSNF